jgi:UDP-N-acetylmuramate--alanine ligase
MSPLAMLLLRLGYTVLGSDNQPLTSPVMQQLAEAGATLLLQDTVDTLPADALVVMSTAIKPSHPQRHWAEARQQPALLWHRSQLLAALLHTALAHTASQANAPYHWVGLSGTHGKTTLTGWVGYLLEQAMHNVAVLAGGKLPYAPQASNLYVSPAFGQTQGQPCYAVAELDESDGTLVNYRPSVLVVANLELDHADHYGQGIDTLLATFTQTLEGMAQACDPHPALSQRERVKKCVVAWAGCANTVAVVAPFVGRLRVLWVGEAQHLEALPPNAQAHGELITLSHAQVQANGTFIGQLHLPSHPLPSGEGRVRDSQSKVLEGRPSPAAPAATSPEGRGDDALLVKNVLGQRSQEREGAITLNPALLGYHSLSNAALATVATWACGVPASAIAPHINGFSGMGRRFETLHTSPALTVIDDYAHHPTEIEATLKAARAAYPSHKLVALCQPHRFSRLATFMAGFAQALTLADAVGLIDVYPAGENPEAFTHATTTQLAEKLASLAPSLPVACLGGASALTTTLSPWLAEMNTSTPTLLLNMGAGDNSSGLKAWLATL